MSARHDAVRLPDLSPDRVVVEHAELVSSVAYYLVRKMPVSVEVDDLIQAGMIGLLNAAANFSPAKGVSFKHYARIRIHGAILDEARKTDGTPRSTWRNARQVAEAVRGIETRIGRHARPVEVADALEISLDEYHQILERAALRHVLSLEELADDSERAGLLPECSGPGPAENLEEDDIRKALIQAIDSLMERDQLVLSLYYAEELTLREIGEMLEISTSRTCQIHRRALVRLRAALPQWSEPEALSDRWSEDSCSTATRQTNGQQALRSYRARDMSSTPEWG